MNQIESRLNDAYKQALKEKNKPVVACVRQVKAKVQELSNAKGFSGDVNDAVYLKAIASYVKSLNKALAELPAGHDLVAGYQFEIDYLSEYLPKKLGEEETKTLVQGIVSKVGASSKADTGKVMGALMKEHKDEVDPAVVKKILGEILA